MQQCIFFFRLTVPSAVCKMWSRQLPFNRQRKLSRNLESTWCSDHTGHKHWPDVSCDKIVLTQERKPKVPFTSRKEETREFHSHNQTVLLIESWQSFPLDTKRGSTHKGGFQLECNSLRMAIRSTSLSWSCPERGDKWAKEVMWKVTGTVWVILCCSSELERDK